MADPLAPKTEEDIAAADALTACLGTLFGEGAFENWLECQLGADGALKACIQACIVDVLTDPEASPITKEMLGEIIQGKDVDGDGGLGATVENPTQTQIETGQVTFTSSATAVATNIKGGTNPWSP